MSKKKTGGWRRVQAGLESSRGLSTQHFTCRTAVFFSQREPGVKEGLPVSLPLEGPPASTMGRKGSAGKGQRGAAASLREDQRRVLLRAPRPHRREGVPEVALVELFGRFHPAASMSGAAPRFNRTSPVCHRVRAPIPERTNGAPSCFGNLRVVPPIPSIRGGSESLENHRT